MIALTALPQLLVTTTSSPRVLTLYSSKGLGGGPPMFFPLKLYWPLWQAHQICFVSSRYWTMHSRCVHTAENALNSPVAVWTRIPGLFPNLKIFPELTGTSLSF